MDERQIARMVGLILGGIYLAILALSVLSGRENASPNTVSLATAPPHGAKSTPLCDAC
jgi:hypothetical protein